MNTNFRKQLEEIEVPIPSSAQGLFNAPPTIGTFLGSDLVDAIVKLHEAENYLSHFSYVDWNIGEDDKLRLGDFINCNHQRPHDGYEQNFEGQIVAHHANGLPVVIYNIDPREPDNSGEYADLQSLMMDGWEFSRRAAIEPKKEGE